MLVAASAWLLAGPIWAGCILGEGSAREDDDADRIRSAGPGSVSCGERDWACQYEECVAQGWEGCRFFECGASNRTEEIYTRSGQLVGLDQGEDEFAVAERYVCADIRVHVQGRFPEADIPEEYRNYLAFYQNGTEMARTEFESLLLELDGTAEMQGALWPGRVTLTWNLKGHGDWEVMVLGRLGLAES